MRMKIIKYELHEWERELNEIYQKILFSLCSTIDEYCAIIKKENKKYPAKVYVTNIKPLQDTYIII